MMCYKDRTYCSAACTTQSCSRQFTNADRAGANKWWENCEGEAPIAFSDFSPSCLSYDPPKEVIRDRANT